MVVQMGLRIELVTFQSLTNSIIMIFFEDFMFVYEDDILINNAKEEEHVEHLRTVLGRLWDQKLLTGNGKLKKYIREDTKFLELRVGKMEVGIDE